jgi:hypothetical protein
MHWTHWVVALLTFIRSSWMLFDGTRALTIGDYVTPRSGSHAGRLGPWAALVEAAGIPARSTGMKIGFVVLGAFGLLAVALQLCGSRWAWHLLFAAACSTIWYLPIGTATSVATIGLLLWTL